MDAVENEIFNREEKECSPPPDGNRSPWCCHGCNKDISSLFLLRVRCPSIKDLYAVAYVRFASVYREFKDVNTFVDELKKMLE